jgi:hypothetical protein
MCRSTQMLRFTQRGIVINRVLCTVIFLSRFSYTGSFGTICTGSLGGVFGAKISDYGSHAVVLVQLQRFSFVLGLQG